MNNRAIVQWGKTILNAYEDKFGDRPSLTPNVINIEPDIQERMMRVGIEARALGAENQDDVATIAHLSLLQDRVNSKSDR